MLGVYATYMELAFEWVFIVAGRFLTTALLASTLPATAFSMGRLLMIALGFSALLPKKHDILCFFQRLSASFLCGLVHFIGSSSPIFRLLFGTLFLLRFNYWVLSSFCGCEMAATSLWHWYPLGLAVLLLPLVCYLLGRSGLRFLPRFGSKFVGWRLASDSAVALSFLHWLRCV